MDLERACTVYKTELEGKTEQMEMIRNQVCVDIVIIKYISKGTIDDTLSIKNW